MKVLVDNDLQRLIDTSIQSIGEYANTIDMDSMISLLALGVNPSQVPSISRWYSKQRDKDFFNTYPDLDIIPGVVTRQVNIVSDMEHVWRKDTPQGIKDYYSAIIASADFGNGFPEFVSYLLHDYRCSDAGLFVEFIGEGQTITKEIEIPATGGKIKFTTKGPIEGPVMGMAHLESLRCIRTGNPIWPVEYADPVTGDRIRYHRSRVYYKSDSPRGQQRQTGIGFCALSKCLLSGKKLMATDVYEYERLRGRDITKVHLLSGIKESTVQTALERAQERLSNKGYTTYAPAAIAGQTSVGFGNRVEAITLNLGGLIENYNVEENTRVAVFKIALAFGTDVREIWATTTSGSTRADAEIGYKLKRDSGLGHVSKVISNIINDGLLPSAFRGYFGLGFIDELQKSAEYKERVAEAAILNEAFSIGAIGIDLYMQQAIEKGVFSEDAMEYLNDTSQNVLRANASTDTQDTEGVRTESTERDS